MSPIIVKNRQENGGSMNLWAGWDSGGPFVKD